MSGERAMQTYELLIGGDWTPGSGGAYGVVNPATEQVINEAPEATAADAEAAAQAARDALPAWKHTSPEERANLLHALAEETRKRTESLLPLIMAETGATLKVGSALQLRQPVGVVACISPYNFPLVNMAGKVGPALATGNTVVMKPAPQDPLAIIELAEICQSVGFPPGVVNVVTGSKPEVGEALVDSKNVDMISFTGSTGVGVRIYEAGGKTMKRLLLELGGKGACIVCDDADLQQAIMGLVSVWGFHSGQICTAPTRAIVHRSIYDQLVGGLRAAAPSLTIGPPESEDTVVGPVISAAHRDRVEHYIELGEKEGGDLVVDGRRPDGVERGYYVGPTLLTNCRNDMTAVREEIFGPVIVVVPFDDDDDEAVAIANDSDFGLYDYVFSQDTGRAFGIARQLEAGHVGINTAQRNHEAPFGGFKMSGVGRDGG